MKNKKIKIEITLDELDLIINDIGYWDYEYNLSNDELALLDKLEQIKKENEKTKKEESNAN